MDLPADCPLASTLAARMRAHRDELVARWLERIAARVSLDPNRVFPTDDLLDHVPLLVVGIADYMEDPADEIAADVPVVAKAIELGALRHAQGFDAYQIMKEYEILGGVIFAFLTSIVDEIHEPCTRGELLQCTHRLFRAVSLIQQATTMQFLRMIGEQVREREERLRRFNRMVSHELKTRIGGVVGGAAMLQESWVGPEERARFLAMVADNAREANAVLDSLTTLSRLDGLPRQQRNILLPQAVAEAVRQLREMARARGVVVRVADDLPQVEVNAAAVELCVSNYLSNAIKYCDPEGADRWVAVGGFLRLGGADARAGELVVEVRDNGLGVPAEERAQLFHRFHRAHERTVTGVEGTGLGLSIVRETVESLGGRAWAEFADGGGSTFAFALPYRRREDVTAEGARARTAGAG